MIFMLDFGVSLVSVANQFETAKRFDLVSPFIGH
jgi:hypothetical protein